MKKAMSALLALAMALSLSMAPAIDRKSVV